MIRPTRRVALAVVALLACFTAAGPLPAQQRMPDPATAVLPHDIYVGDVFHAAVRLDLPPGTRAILPDTLIGGEDLEPAGRVEIRSDALPGGGTRLTGLYPLTVWRTGESSIEPLPIRLLSDGGEVVVHARFPVVAVTSVLPADTTDIEPKPAKDVIGPNRVMWPWILGGLALLLALIALYLWRRRRRPVAAFERPDFDPRATALAALTAERAEQLLRSGNVRLLYIELSDALRFYAATIAPAFARDRTTAELSAAAPAAAIADADVAELLALLTHADAVKFAARDVAADDARSDWQAAREWVARVEAPAPVAAGTLEAAA
jgi:hypothetical protein